MSTLASVHGYDLAANLPAASIPGRLFNASDTGQRFRDNGTSWNSLDIARGVSTKTANYTALASDNGTLIVMNSSTAKTLTLPSASPGTWWSVAIQNVGAGTLTVSPSGLLIDTSSSNLSLTTGQGCDIYSDGTNYFTMRGQGSASSSTSGAIGAVIMSSSNQTMPNGATTAVTLGTVTKDTGGFSGVTANSLVAPVAGWYNIAAGAQLGNWTASLVGLNVTVNGSIPLSTNTLPRSQNNFNSSGYGALSVSGGLWLNSGDTVALSLYQNQGSSQIISGAFLSIIGGGGGGLTAAPPYLTDGNGNYYVAQTGYKATLPAAAPSFLSSATFTPVVGTNGSIVAATSGAVWVKISCSSVIELVHQCILYGNWASVWAYDGTNIYAFYSGPNSSGWNFQKWTYGTTPAYSSNISLATSPGIIAGFVHSRLAYSGGTLSAQVSLDGSTWVTCGTVSSGALTQGGYVINSATAFIVSLKGA